MPPAVCSEPVGILNQLFVPYGARWKEFISNNNCPSHRSCYGITVSRVVHLVARLGLAITFLPNCCILLCSYICVVWVGLSSPSVTHSYVLRSFLQLFGSHMKHMAHKQESHNATTWSIPRTFEIHRHRSKQTHRYTCRCSSIHM